ncbi:MAG: HNH endonuclease [Spirochaetales bacterium]|nr:HNH endonuclease [Spirochaetales bacterium]
MRAEPPDSPYRFAQGDPKRSIWKMNNIDTIESSILALLDGNKKIACSNIQENFPHVSTTRFERRYTERQSLAVFIRDGFIDRYSGEKLLFPGVLRILSLSLPTEFPYQTHWKTTETHIAYWKYYPTVDHIIPIARGGADSSDNFVTTSQLRNSAKSHWLLEEIGWELHPEGNMNDWDGLMGLTSQFVNQNPDMLSDNLLKKWIKATNE